jgi:hypothetical protein
LKVVRAGGLNKGKEVEEEEEEEEEGGGCSERPYIYYRGNKIYYC